MVIFGDGQGRQTNDPYTPEVEQRYVYTPFGHKYWEMRTSADNPAGLLYNPDFGFTGQRFEELLDLTYFNARWYDQTVARFIQADTEFATGQPNSSQSLNRYSYVNNNPIMATDPSGHFLVTLALIALEGAIAGAAAGAATAAATGGDIGKGAVNGGIGGALGVVLGPIAGAALSVSSRPSASCVVL